MAMKPVAKPDFYRVVQDGVVSVGAGVGLLANDYDLDSAALIAANYSQPAHGTVSLVTDGSFTYTPTKGYFGTDSFTYTDQADGQTSNSATVTIQITQPLLSVNNDSYKIAAGTKLVVGKATGLLFNDLSTGGTLIAQNYGQPAHGTVSLVTDGSFTYTPNAGFYGSDSFSYSAGNGIGTDSATVAIDVVEAAPIANPDTYVVRAGASLSVDAAHGLLLNDTAFGGTLIAQNYGQAAHGTVSLVTDGSFTYTPTKGYVGADSFSYTVGDGIATASSTVTIEVADTAPIANNDYYRTTTGLKLSVPAARGLLVNDFDADDDTLSAQNYSQAAHGAVSLVTDGSFTYTPAAGFSGTDSFTYTTGDGSLTDQATVTITVGPPPATVVAGPDFYAVDENGTLVVPASRGLLLNDYGPFHTTLIAANYSQPAHGTVSLVTDGSFTYTPTKGYFGTDSFTYTDQADGQTSNSATVTIQITQPLLSVNNDSYKIAAGTKLVVGKATGLLFNDLSTGGTLIAQNYGQPAHGTVSLVTDGSFTYTPNAGFYGSDSFSYSAGNGIGTDSATVAIDVVEAAPIANPDTYVVRAGASLSVDAAHGLLLNDTAFGGTLIAQNYGQAAHGTVSLVTDGSFTYTPTKGYVGADSFSYTAGDGIATASSTVTIEVVDTAPIANNDYYKTAFGTKLVVSAARGLLLNDFDADDDTLSAQNYSQAAHGAVSLVTDGSFTYTPAAGFSGTDSFTYTAGDGALTASATVSIDVIACYAAGTLIATPQGQVQVEDLRAGDLVTTPGLTSGAAPRSRPVRWVGRRSYAGRFLAANPRVQPIRIRAGALAAGLPQRDLLVSPDHAMFLDGVLVPARALVNGTTITRQHGLRQVDYFHIELDDHGLLLAEGCLSESFVDDDSRGSFHNADEHRAWFPGHVAAPPVYCAPRASGGEVVDRIRRRLTEVRALADVPTVETLPQVA